MNAVEPSSRNANAPSDAALVVAARAGENWACEALYRRHVGTVHGLACRLLGRDTDIDDILQESFITALTSLDKLEDPAAFRSWLGGVVVRKTCKLIRRRRLLARLGLFSREEPVDLDRILARSAPPEAVIELRAVYRLLEQLPTDIRTMFLLRRVEGATLPEIAKWMDTSLATVKRRLAKAEELLASSGHESHANADDSTEEGGQS